MDQNIWRMLSQFLTQKYYPQSPYDPPVTTPATGEIPVDPPVTTPSTPPMPVGGAPHMGTPPSWAAHLGGHTPTGSPRTANDVVHTLTKKKGTPKPVKPENYHPRQPQPPRMKFKGIATTDGFSKPSKPMPK